MEEERDSISKVTHKLNFTLVVHVVENFCYTLKSLRNDAVMYTNMG